MPICGFAGTVCFTFPTPIFFPSSKIFLDSDIRYLLTSTHPECDRNIDIPTGYFRLINLELPPFSFCKPILAIDDWVEGKPVRQLALWEQKDLADINTSVST
jgi:hypothetical protein